MINRSLVRALVTSAALVGAGLLMAGCNGDDISLANNAKANQPVPPKLIADMTAKDMDLQSPILVRLFKQEAELEIWKQDRSGRFALLKTYPICRWSGDLGPKVREGDRHADKEHRGKHHGPQESEEKAAIVLPEGDRVVDDRLVDAEREGGQQCERDPEHAPVIGRPGRARTVLDELRGAARRPSSPPLPVSPGPSAARSPSRCARRS